MCSALHRPHRSQFPQTALHCIPHPIPPHLISSRLVPAHPSSSQRIQAPGLPIHPSSSSHNVIPRPHGAYTHPAPIPARHPSARSNKKISARTHARPRSPPIPVSHRPAPHTTRACMPPRPPACHPARPRLPPSPPAHTGRTAHRLVRSRIHITHPPPRLLARSPARARRAGRIIINPQSNPTSISLPFLSASILHSPFSVCAQNHSASRLPPIHSGCLLTDIGHWTLDKTRRDKTRELEKRTPPCDAARTFVPVLFSGFVDVCMV